MARNYGEEMNFFINFISFISTAEKEQHFDRWRPMNSTGIAPGEQIPLQWGKNNHKSNSIFLKKTEL